MPKTDYTIYREFRRFHKARDAHNIARRMTPGEFFSIRDSVHPDNWDYVLRSARPYYGNGR